MPSIVYDISWPTPQSVQQFLDDMSSGFDKMEERLEK